MYYPSYRMRRLRQSPSLRRLVRETVLSVDDLVLPLIVTHGENVRDPIAGMPGCNLCSIGTLLDEVREAYGLGLRALLLFGVPSHRDVGASAAYDAEGTVQMAVKAIKDELPDLVVITDVCLCAYTDSGHCGVFQEGQVLNDVTLEVLAKVAISHAEAGADIISPSDMMDGRVAAIRNALDDEGLFDTVVMPAASRFASAFGDPFNAATGARPLVGDQLTYLLDPANGEEAVREALLDIEEGADIIMISRRCRTSTWSRWSSRRPSFPWPCTAPAASTPCSRRRPPTGGSTRSAACWRWPWPSSAPAPTSSSPATPKTWRAGWPDDLRPLGRRASAADRRGGLRGRRALLRAAERRVGARHAVPRQLQALFGEAQPTVERLGRLVVEIGAQRDLHAAGLLEQVQAVAQ
jgi:porphobilinogen synthase